MTPRRCSLPVALAVTLSFIGCGDTPTRPGKTVITSTVTVASEKTGFTSHVAITSDEAQPPSCAWRDLVIARHIAQGGSKTDVVTLNNQQRVFIQDTGAAPGYLLKDYPEKWCL